jgi:CGNR zinc finger
MKWCIFSLTIIAAISTAARAGDVLEPSTDMRRQGRAQQRAAAAQNAQVSPADVGDADSFGRNVHFLGLAFTGVTQLQGDCSSPFFTGPDDRCFVPNAAPAASLFDVRDVGRMKLPAKSTNSLLCHSLTSQPLWHFSNATANTGNAQFRYLVFVTIENEVLNDPNLIDPTTGQPFGGVLEQGFSMIAESHPRLVWNNPRSLTIDRVRRQDTPAEILAPVAEAAAELLATADFTLVKRCEDETCVLWFSDQTRSHHRRWCSPALCGNRHKVAAYRKRRRAEGAM